ncbi:MAG TPA: hypothetical protein VMF89_17175, partial [Polyangiales bacterium]|nr:hypothetical protein [Polyangiales bacterium]
RQARPCGGDSGSPLINPSITGRPFYTGMGSLFSNTAAGCNNPSGSNIFYSGLSHAQATWLLGNVLGLKSQFALPFSCSASTAGPNYFRCNNDGSV